MILPWSRPVDGRASDDWVATTADMPGSPDDLGATHGCKFTAEDLTEYAELSDEELDSVAGGRSCEGAARRTLTFIEPDVETDAKSRMVIEGKIVDQSGND